MRDCDLRFGRWQDVLADVECDTWISDHPFGERTHRGHDAGSKQRDQLLCTNSRTLGYGYLTDEDVQKIADHWAPRTRGWMCPMMSHDLIPAWEAAFERHDRYYFAPLPVLEFYRPRLLGDGPGARCVFMMVGRPRSRAFLDKHWGSLPGAYRGPLPSKFLPRDVYERSDGEPRPERMGGKSMLVMRAIVRDYSRPGDLVCDAFAGLGTTLLAALIEGRRAVGAECDEETFEAAQRRISQGYTPDMFSAIGR